MKRIGKKSIIGGILALSMVLTGTGFAYWTDTLNVTTKATTGELDVTFVDLGLYAQYSADLPTDSDKAFANYWSIVDGIFTGGHTGFLPSDHFKRGTSYNEIAEGSTIESYTKLSQGFHTVTFDGELVDAEEINATVGPYNGTNTSGSDKITLTVNKIYPGYAQAFRTDIVNVGNIAAKLSDINFKVNGLEDYDKTNQMNNMIGIALYIEREDFGSDAVGNGEAVFQLCSLMENRDSIFTVGGVDFLRLSALKTLDDGTLIQGFLRGNALHCIPSDNRMDLYLGIAMDPDAKGDYTSGQTSNKGYRENAARDAKTENKGLEISMDFLWDQFNTDVSIDTTTNILTKQNIGNGPD